MKIHRINYSYFKQKIAFLLLISTLSLGSGDESSTASFVHQTFNYTNMSGENITIPCILNTLNKVECHWLLNSQHQNLQLKFPIENKYNFQRYPMNGDCSIRISNLNMKEDDGDWQCQVYFNKIRIAPVARVTILMPPDRPKILFKNRVPEEGKITVEANKTTQIECISSNGNPVPQLNWVLNRRPVEEGKSFKNISTGNIKDTLTYVFDKTMNGYRLVCDSQHQLINEVDEVELDVVYKPEVRIDNDVITVEEGSDLRNVYCNVEANPPARIKWYDTSNPKILFSDFNELRLVNINKDQNNRIFECWAENEIGRSNTDSFRLNVLYEPRIISEGENQRVKLGKTVSFNCQIEANPAPSINWYYSSVLTGEIKKVETELNNPSILFIKNVTYNDEGDYYCEGSNRINDQIKIVRSKEINLKVYGQPALLREKEVENGKLDGFSEIDLDFCSDPQPSLIYWRANNCRMVLKLPDENDQLDRGIDNAACQRYITGLRRINNQVPKENDQSNCYKATLIINETKMEDEMNYVLVVENSEGKIEHSIKLNVTSPLSLLVLIILVLITFILLIAIGFLVIVVLRRKHKGSENMNDDDVLKEEAQTISHKSDLENGTSKTDFNQLNLNTSNDSYELVYANLDFPAREQQNEQLFQSNNMNLNLQQQQQLLQQKPISQMKSTNPVKFPLPEGKRQPPQVKPKPQIRPQHTPRQTNGSTTEYAKLTFNKADL